MSWSLLFSIYTNDLPNASGLFNCKINADDTTVIVSLGDFFYAKCDSKLSISILNNKLGENQLLVNSFKLYLNNQISCYFINHTNV